jgi:hypothetical protein
MSGIHPFNPIPPQEKLRRRNHYEANNEAERVAKQVRWLEKVRFDRDAEYDTDLSAFIREQTREILP